MNHAVALIPHPTLTNKAQTPDIAILNKRFTLTMTGQDITSMRSRAMPSTSITPPTEPPFPPSKLCRFRLRLPLPPTTNLPHLHMTLYSKVSRNFKLLVIHPKHISAVPQEARLTSHGVFTIHRQETEDGEVDCKNKLEYSRIHPEDGDLTGSGAHFFFLLHNLVLTSFPSAY